MHVILLFFLVTLGTRTSADPTVDAVAALHRGGDQIVPLDAGARREVQAYFEGIYAKVRLPGEGPAPTVLLVRPLEPDTLAFVHRAHPDFVFWNAEFFLKSPNGDVDAYTLAHELGHFTAENRRFHDVRSMEYHSDGQAVWQRLFRIDLRDERGRPQNPVVSVDALIDWAEAKAGGYRRDYVDATAMASGLKVIFAAEHTKRDFPKRPTPRAISADLLALVTNALANVPVAPHVAIARDDDASSDATLIAARARGDFASVLQTLDARRATFTAEAPRALRAKLTLEFADTVLLTQQRLADPAEKGPAQIKLFDQLAQLPLDLFSNWSDLLQRYGPDGEAMSHFREDARAFDPFHANQFAADEGVELGIRSALTRPATLFDERQFPWAASRLMYQVTPLFAGADFAHEPVTLLYFVSLLRRADHWRAARGNGESATIAAFRDGLAPLLGRGDVGQRLGEALLNFVLKLKPDSAGFENLYQLFATTRLDEDFPGARAYLLGHLPEHSRFAALRLQLEMITGDGYATYLRDLSARDPTSFARLLVELHRRDPDLYAAQNFGEIWLEFLEARAKRGEPHYFWGLNAAVEALGAHLPDTEMNTVTDLGNFDLQITFNADLKRWSRALTDLVKIKPDDFLLAWASEELRNKSRLATLVDWTEVFASFTVDQFEFFLEWQSRLLEDPHLSYSRLRTALLERMVQLVKTTLPPSDQLIAVSTDALNACATTTPAGQALMGDLVASLRVDRSASGLERLYHFLVRANVINFPDVAGLADLYATTIIARHEFEAPYPSMPLATFKEDVRSAYTHFDGLVARRVVDRLAQGYHAGPELRDVTKAPKLEPRRMDPEVAAQYWRLLVAQLTQPEVVKLDEALKLGDPITPEFRLKLQIRLCSLAVWATYRDVEPELRARYAAGGAGAWVKAAHPVLIDSAFKPTLRQTTRNFEGTLAGKDVHVAGEMLDLHISQHAVGNDDLFDTLIYQRDTTAFDAAVEHFHVFYQVLKRLNAQQVLNLLDVLRGNAPLEKGLARVVHQRLIGQKIVVPIAAVEAYLSQQFHVLSPLHRASVFEMLLEGGNRLIDNPEFRRLIFSKLIRRLPDAATRATFVDLWEAGLKALPHTLRSLILAMTMSESGEVGSPEQALVALLSHLGPLEQKFGQALAFADLPRSYRRALEKLWNGAQALKWDEAWDLILVQLGDIREAGFRLARILNSGSTVAYLEIENVTTGERLVVSVYRDGIEHAVKVGAEQLRTFARELVAKDPVRYGFLPLLIEDAIRTVSKELDPERKLRMTKLMAEAYRRAAVRKGYEVDAEGFIHANGFTFATAGEREIRLPNGRVIKAQQLAPGQALQDFREVDPARYRALTDTLLGLEAEVLRDPTAPVDKDRMPGQNLFDPATNRNFILDAGQAEFLTAPVHAKFIEFTRRAFAADVNWLDQTIFELTSVDVREVARARDLGDAAVGVRPLTYLGKISPKFLAMAEDDPRRVTFFELLHGVRAELRLLQWAEREGSNALGRAAFAEVVSQSGGWRLGWDWVTSRMRKFTSVKGFDSAAEMVERMERAYLTRAESPAPCEPDFETAAQP